MTIAIRTPQAKLARNGPSVVLCLSSLREAVRTRWEAICAATTANLERLIRLKLGPSDVFLQIDELNWLVVMPSSRMEDALTCCLRIAYELHVSVIPLSDLGQLKISRAVAVGDDVLDLAPLSGEQLHAVAKRAGLAELLAGKGKEASQTTALSSEPRGSHRFEPVWDAQHQVVGSYRCLSDTGVAPGDSVGHQLKHTQAMLDDVVRVLEQRLAQRARCMVFIPIPYDVLSAPPARMELLATCRQLKCSLRPFLVFEIVTLAAGIPKHRLTEIVSAIQPFARAVIARVAQRNPSLMDYGGAGLKALGFDLNGSHTEAAEIARLCQAGKRLGMGAYLGSVASARLLELAVGHGVQWASGPAIGMPVSEPAQPSRLSLDTIVQSWDEPVQAGASG
jgi:hypothetical protein